ncbi:RHS repeat-associated core domain-containing protein [Pseudomonas maumuensis]|nr:RHS repeat-associated core domain-containing protein [Pseudomonas maumuensis]
MTSSGRTAIAYTPYGWRPAPQEPSMTEFTGQLREVELGCYLLGNGHRAFCPSLMRFFSADVMSPFGTGGVNSYAYCQGDPINKIDPTGQAGWLPHHVTIAANGLTLAATGLDYVNKKITGEHISYTDHARLAAAGTLALWGEVAGIHQYQRGDEGGVVADVTTVLAPLVFFADQLGHFGMNSYRWLRERMAARSGTPPPSPNQVIVNRREPNIADRRATTVGEAVNLAQMILTQQDGVPVTVFQFPPAAELQDSQASIRDGIGTF